MLDAPQNERLDTGDLDRRLAELDKEREVLLEEQRRQEKQKQMLRERAALAEAEAKQRQAVFDADAEPSLSARDVAISKATKENDVLLRLEDVLSRISISRSAWHRLVATGEAPKPVHLGRCALWRASELNAWIASIKA